MTTGKRVASATFQLTLSNALARLISLITMPLLTHWLTPNAYGTAALVGTLIALASMFAIAGMDMSYVRAYHATGRVSGQAAEAVSWRFTLMSALLVGAAVAASWPLIAAPLGLPDYLGVLVGSGILLSVTATMAQGRARIHNRYRHMSVAVIVSGLAAAATSLSLAYWWRQDELPLVFALITGYLVPVAVLGTPGLSLLFRSSGLQPSERRQLIGIGIAGTMTAPAYWVMSSSDRWFLGYFEDTASVGIYSIAYSVGIMGMMANSAITAVWAPEVAREYETDRQRAPTRLGIIAERLLIAAAVVWLAVTAAGSDVIRLLAAPSFHKAGELVPYIAAAVFFHAVTHIANASLLVKKRLGLALWCWLAAGILCWGLNLVLVPELGRLGAALTQTVSFAVLSLLILAGAQRLFPLQFHWGRLGSLLLLTLLLGLIMMKPWSPAPALSLLFKLPAGIAAAVALAWCSAPEAVQSRLGRRPATS